MGNFQCLKLFGSTCPAVCIDEGVSEIAVLKNHYFQVKLCPYLTNAIRYNRSHMLLYIPSIRGCDTGLAIKPSSRQLGLQ